MTAWIPLVLSCSSAPSAEPTAAQSGAPRVEVTLRPLPAVEAPHPGTIVAVGDVHGDLDNFQRVLQAAGLIDPSGMWIGGTAILVQTGDTTDRGPDSKEVIEFLMQLEGQAEVAGGRIVSLLGNHEAMNILGDWRYVSPEDIAHFGGEEARRVAFGADAPIGAWLRKRDAAVVVGDTVFVHGGITPEWARVGVEGLSVQVRAALSASAGARVLGPDGPLWYRGYVRDPEGVACTALADALRSLRARRMVVGHTGEHDGRVVARCGGALLAIDVGLADHYGAHEVGVVIRGGDAATVVAGGGVDLPDPA